MDKLPVTKKTPLEIAQSQIGYKEGKNNDNKYGKYFGFNNVAWCAQFVSYCLKKAGIEYAYASCERFYQQLKTQKKLVKIEDSIPGDIVFFQFDKDDMADHIGIIESNNKEAKTLTTIEGNTSSGNAGSQHNGDGVYRRIRTYTLVKGVGRVWNPHLIIIPMKKDGGCGCK